MNKVMNVLSNYWFRALVSLSGIVFSALLLYFDYIVFFYDIEYTDKKQFAIIMSGIMVVMGLMIFYTRRSFITIALAMLDLLLFFPVLLLDWGNWPLIIPCAVTVLFGFFCCTMNETAKTIFGTIFLLIYILGGIAFFLVMNVFRTTTVDTVIEQGVSPSGSFRYYVLDVQNKSTGKVCVYVQPNTLDVDKGFIQLDCTIKKLIKQSPKPAELTCEWVGSTMLINGEVYFDENNYLTADDDGIIYYDIDGGDWTYTYFSIDYPIFDTIEEVKDIVDSVLAKTSEDDEGDESDEDEEAEESSSDVALTYEDYVANYGG